MIEAVPTQGETRSARTVFYRRLDPSFPAGLRPDRPPSRTERRLWTSKSVTRWKGSSSGRADALERKRAANVVRLAAMGMTPASAIRARVGVERVQPRRYSQLPVQDFHVRWWCIW